MFTKQHQQLIGNVIQTIYADLSEEDRGDPECLAEMVSYASEMYEPELRAHIISLNEQHGFRTVQKEMSKYCNY